MEYKELQNLIKLIDSSSLTEFKMKEGEFELQIRTKDYFKQSKQASQVVQTPVVTSAPAPQPAVVPEPPMTEATQAEKSAKSAETEAGGSQEESHLLEIKSPIVGTFYRSPSPDKDVYVKIGDKVDVGSVVCIVEAMKLFNEIESEVKGKIVEILVEDSTPVEYDQVLFKVDPS